MNPDPAAAPPISAAHRSTLAANYILLFLATFTLGLFAPMAAILAYARRGRADPVARTHYDFQIKSFWQDVGLIVLGWIAAYLAIASGVGALIGLTGVTLPFGINLADTAWAALVFGVLWVVLWVWGFINLIVDSVTGGMRLAAGRPMGKTLRR